MTKLIRNLLLEYTVVDLMLFNSLLHWTKRDDRQKILDWQLDVAITESELRLKSKFHPRKSSVYTDNKLF